MAVTPTTGATLFVPEGQTLRDYAVVLSGAAGTPEEVVKLSGTLEITQPAASLFAITAGEDARKSVVLDATGVLRVVGGPSDVVGAYHVIEAHGPSLFNHGLIEITGGQAYGVASEAFGGLYRNYGTIRVTGEAGSAGVNWDAPILSTVGLENYGLIEAINRGGSEWGSVSAVRLNGRGFHFHNYEDAKITARSSSGSQNETIAVEINSIDGPTSEGGHINYGLIEGDYALKFTHTGRENNNWFLNETTGVLRGKVILDGDGTKLDNAGLVEGSVLMGAGNQTYTAWDGGIVTGMVSGGEGDDDLYGGPGFDYFQGNQGADTESGRAGDDWVVGGKDNDWLSGDDGADILNGNLGDDRADGGAGADIVRGGQGNDSLSGGDGDDWLFGDLGADTISGGSGADRFFISASGAADRIMDFKAAEGDRLSLEPGAQYSVAQQGPDTAITFAGGGQVTLVGVTASSLPPGWIVV